MTEWQPIETAPKDGLFLINDVNAKNRKIKLCSGNRIKRNQEKYTTYGNGLWQDGFTMFDDRGNPTKATHWMPLPEPPK